MLKNLVVLINGAASTLGQATANRLAKKGAQIVLTDLPNTNGATIANGFGDNVHFIPSDARSEQSVEILLNTIRKSYGKLNVLVNCLGHANTQRANESDDFEFLSKRLETNLYGTFNMIKTAVGMIGDNEPDENHLAGVVINTIGLDGVHRINDRPIIAAAYGSILGIARSTATDLAGRGIRVNTIIPPLMESSSPEIQKFYKENHLAVASKLNTNPDNFAHIVQTIILNPYMNLANVDLSGGVTRLF